MRRFWWLAAIIFLVSFGIYTVGSGWISQWTVTSNVRHARRQLEVEKVLADLQRAQEALRMHRDRVLAFAFIFKEPNFEPTYAVFRDLEGFIQVFRGLAPMQSEDAAPTPQFMAAIERLKAYRVQSLSVIGQTTQTALLVLVWISGVMTVLLLGTRLLGTE